MLRAAEHQGVLVIYTDKWIFVHVPKAAGTSLSMALGGKSPGYPTHTPLRCVEKGQRVAFGFVRNPWARMVSLYRFLCQKPFRNTDNFDQAGVRAAGFKRWLMQDEFFMQEDILPTGKPWIVRSRWRGDGVSDLPPMQRRPQMWWLDGCDIIGRVENLPEDYRRICRMIDITPHDLRRANATAGGDWRAEYDDETRAFVAEHFAPDIERFGYSC